MTATKWQCPHCGTFTPSEHGEGCPNENSGSEATDHDEDKILKWETPCSYIGERGTCYACGKRGTQFVGLASANYSLCKTCVMDAELTILDTARQYLKTKVDKAKRENT